METVTQAYAALNEALALRSLIKCFEETDAGAVRELTYAVDSAIHHLANVAASIDLAGGSLAGMEIAYKVAIPDHVEHVENRSELSLLMQKLYEVA